MPFIEEEKNNVQSGLIKQWSFSTLDKFEQCPYRLWIQKGMGFAEPQHPAAERGTKIHDGIERYIKGEEKALPADVQKRGGECISLIEEARERWQHGKAHVEEMWGFTAEWSPTGFFNKDTWARIKVDAMVLQDDTSAVVIDWKTGRSKGNELKHGQQGTLYALATLMYEPKIEHVAVKLAYVDEGLVRAYPPMTREKAAVLMPRWTERAAKLTTAKIFPPNPSKFACKWCPYKDMTDAEGNVLCEHGVK
jgi:CRISPR/Cas system-associated exonuclease Cas4 (RecB family)